MPDTISNYLLVPQDARQEGATIWLGAVNQELDPNDTFLFVGDQKVPLSQGWKDWKSENGRYRLQYQHFKAGSLTPGSTYRVRWRTGQETVARGEFKTLPRRLPNATEKPFTVMLGSCFFRASDRDGSVGYTYLKMFGQEDIDLKILCGDQVYLDNPWYHFLLPRGRDWLQARCFRTYFEAWGQSLEQAGFQQLLQNGSNCFTADDHEFWNNAPDIGLNVPLFTANRSQRNRWFQIALELYRIFQAQEPVSHFEAGQLSFCIVDTRIHRLEKARQLMKPGDFDKIADWIARLSGPGILVLGQPFFAQEGDARDWTLPNFSQYQDLKRILRQSHHSIVILTGDVHYGRIASSPLRPELGTRLVEVISSPMALVDPVATGRFKKAPSSLAPAVTETEAEFWEKKTHFLTVEFTASSDTRVSMDVKFWPIVRQGRSVWGRRVLNRPIELF